ncbi:TonB-dependent receptor P26 [Arenibacter antarcticus]|uniref:TonB-dependent receptor n=1 Tax=Arenibacter antarcticus TaxID=2040469 RepID=A0ABW5VIL8_9FLAO|nr:TonB-dependent receptor [Arenibacter sp. H213]MCM4167105.1 TonB-dependent receptor [Arenibacter sp. H213]
MKKPPNSGELFPWCLKFNLKMKLSLLFLLTVSFVMQANSTYSQKTKISLDLGIATVETVLDEIETKTEFKFIFNTKTIDLNRKVSIKVKKASVERILELLFKEMDVSYELDDRKILLKEKEIKKIGKSIKSPTVSSNVQFQVSGTISDSEGMPLPGASIVEKGTTNGVQSDFDGKFTLDLTDANATLVVSYIGFSTKEVLVGGQIVLNVILEESAAGLDEVVVVGYGTQKKADILGSVSQITSKDLITSPNMNLSSMLQGKLSGVITKQQSGQPGKDGASFKVRGLSTLGSNTPLVVVDGIPRPFPSVNPDEIESITVLKDAASAAVYGVRASNGVIEITTKKGIEQKPEVTFNSAVSISSNTRFPRFLNGPEYAYWFNKAQEMDGVPEPGRRFTPEQMDRIQNGDPQGVFANTDWFNLLFNNSAPSYTKNISLRGGTESVKYFISLGSYNQEGIISRTSYDRYNLRANIDAKVSNNFEIGFKIGAGTSDTKQPGLTAGIGNSYASIFSQAIMSYPYLAAYTPEGKPVGSMNPGNGNQNPITARDLSGSNTTHANKFEGSISLKYNLPAIQGLSFKVNAAHDKGYSVIKATLLPYKLMMYNLGTDSYNEGYARHSLSGEAVINQWFADAWTSTIQSSVNYNRDFDKHSVGGLFLYEYIENGGTGLSGGRKGFPIQDIMDLSYGEEVIDNLVKGGHDSFRRAGYVNRLTYSYDNKYLVEFTGRLDGSPNFAESNRWGFFPAVSLGWRLSDESFWQNQISFFNDLKLKASVGKLGNDAIGRYSYMRTMSLGKDPIALLGDRLSRPLTVDRVPNERISWEKTTSYNAGFESAFFNNKFGIDANVFYMVTTDILQSQSGLKPPSIGGYFPATINDGIVDNRGFEIDLTYKDQIKDFQYNIKGNISWARNKVIRTTENPNVPKDRLLTGKPIGQKYGFKSTGLFQSEEEIRQSALYGPTLPGDVKLVDINGDGRITFDQDWSIIGRSTEPELMFGLNLQANYSNFDFNIFIQGAALSDVALAGYYSDRGFHDDTFYSKPFWNDGNTPLFAVEGAWTPENTNAKYPRLGIENRQSGGKFSDWWVVNGSYARLKSLQVGYTIPQFQNDNLKARIYVSGSNLFTLDYLKHFDPEMPDVNQGYYPQQKFYELGLRLTF